MAKVRRGFSFQQMEIKKPNYSKFNLSHDHLCAMGSGYLVPLWWTEGIPGDTFNCNLSSFMRLLALSSPMLQREDCFVRAFKVPLRILANDRDLDLAYTGGKDGVHPDFPFFSCYAPSMLVGSLYDYLELPLPYDYDNATGSWIKIKNSDVESTPSVSAWPFLAYHRIYMDHFRNEDTEDDFMELFDMHYSDLDGCSTGDAFSDLIETDSDYQLDTLHRVAWERDYFTSALGQTQRGSQVNIPLLGSSNFSINTAQVLDQQGNPSSTAGANGATLIIGTGSDRPLTLDAGVPSGGSFQLVGSVDGSQFTGIGAIALRLAMNLQAFMERNNIAGYRMIGNILAHFGVQSSNRLMEEAEYLGGIKAPITISAVNQTSASEDGSTPQGTQVGTAQAAFNGHLFRTFCEEPCIIMVVGYITAKSSYSQGLARKWTRRSYLDYYWPEFQSIGEQEILNQELYYNWYSGDQNDATWAYQARFSEYKYEPDTISGDFRTTLSYWHQSRLFKTLPAFNNDFVKCNPSDRVFAVNTQTYPRPYLGEFYFDCQVVRPMDKYAQSKLW